MTTTHAVTAVKEVAAPEVGALDGFGAVCTCGHITVSSLRTLAVSWGNDHAAYMNKKEAAAALVLEDGPVPAGYCAAGWSL
jgi:hypothetical protein